MPKLIPLRVLNVVLLVVGAVLTLGVSSPASASTAPRDFPVSARDANCTYSTVDSSCCWTSVGAPRWVDSMSFFYASIMVTTRITCNGSAHVIADPDSFIVARLHRASDGDVLKVDDKTLSRSTRSASVTATYRCVRGQRYSVYSAGWFRFDWRNTQAVRRVRKTEFSSNFSILC